MSRQTRNYCRHLSKGAAKVPPYSELRDMRISGTYGTSGTCLYGYTRVLFYFTSLSFTHTKKISHMGYREVPKVPKVPQVSIECGSNMAAPLKQGAVRCRLSESTNRRRKSL